MQKSLFRIALVALLANQLAAQPNQSSLAVVPSRAQHTPVQLTSSEGVGMRLTHYQARVVLQGPLAFSELHLTFHNPQDRVLEGRFEITLPEGAALSRLAMKNEHGWQEAEVVELQKARQAYEDFLHRRQDPALLEKQAGNQFQARIFPIPAGGSKELIISYSQEVSGDYRLPVSGLPKVDELSVEASVWTPRGETPEKLNYSLHGEAPRGDFLIHQPAPGVAGMVNGQEALVVVKASEGVRSQPKESQNMLVLVDTSASRAAGYKSQISMLRSLLHEWTRRHPSARLKLAAFDQQVVPLSGLDQLAQRRPLGATDLPAALRWASQQQGYSRLLLVSDGVNTVGPATDLQLMKSRLQRLDVLMVGGIRDSLPLQPLVYRSLPHSGFVLDGDKPAAELAGRLDDTPLSGVKVKLAGADWVWPPVLDGVAAREERLVYAHLSQPAQEVAVTVGSAAAYRQPLTPVAQPLLHRSSVAANLARLNQQLQHARGAQREKIASHMVELSTGNRVVCDLTGLLVLETDDDYARFQIDRTALSDILVATPAGLEVQKRSQIVTGIATPNSNERILHTSDDKAEEHGGGQSRERKQESNPASPESSLGQPMKTMAVDGLASGASGPLQQVASPRPVAEPVSSGRRGAASRPRPEPAPEVEQEESVAPLNGRFKEIDSLLRQGKHQQALQQARQWQAKEPGDVLALVALGRCLRAAGQGAEAARAFGSIIDLYPGRADLRRYAGGLLESLGAEGLPLATDSYRQAVQQRPDHPSGSRMLAYSLLRQGKLQPAFQVLQQALGRDYPDGRFASVEEVLRDDLGMVAAAIVARDPDQRGNMVEKLHSLGVPLASKPSLRFILTWETDANDVDFHIKDARGGHAFYSQPALPSGGRLYADVTTGYGPECFNIPGGGQAFPYNISIHYYSRGPMGYGMGKVEIVRHDGKAGFRFEERPFVVMNDHAYVNLGPVKQ